MHSQRDLCFAFKISLLQKKMLPHKLSHSRSSSVNTASLMITILTYLLFKAAHEYPLRPCPAFLQMCQHENIINRFHRILEILIAYTDDDVEFTGTLIDHLDVDMGMGKSR